MATRRVARAACGLRMRNPVGNDTPEGAIIIVDDEPPVAVVEEELGGLNYLSANIGVLEYGKELLKEGLLEKLKGELAYKEGFHPTVEAHSLKEGEDAALGGISLCDNEASMIVLRHHIAETEALLSRVHEEMGDLPPTD
ncbi:hypothetical protein AMTR_s00167p00045820 [Amborella trichopoda]|uniref:Uncharacterized protein n=1 Tax=Amborella trichopoda TaxID=13333 RepID=W1PUB4_AMBTC|nr:hypothetical protein AMTR_s00167p00045820 [Amborella trichopoda]